MNRTHRRLLFLFFLLVFIVVTPLISLYASGYKFGSGFRIEKTGILILDSEPEGAKIFLDGEPQRETIAGFLPKKNAYLSTPIKIKNLLPEEYQVRLELEGYWPWQKKLAVKPGESTFAEDILLFKKELPLLLLAGENLKLHPNKDNSLLVAAGDDMAAVLDPKNGILAERTGKTEKADWDWSPDGKHILNGVSLLRADSLGKAGDLPLLFSVSGQAPVWLNGQTLLAVNNNDILAYNAESGKTRVLAAGAEADRIYADGRYVYSLRDTPASTILDFYDPKDGKLAGSINLPLSDYEFPGRSPELLEIRDSLHHILYLIDPAQKLKPVAEIIENAENTHWINSHQFVYTDGFEIWVMDTGSHNRALVARLSSPVGDIFWHPNKNYIIYSTKTYVATIELDKREKYNITRLIDMPEINAMVMDKNGETLFISGRIGNKAGVYQLMIQ